MAIMTHAEIAKSIRDQGEKDIVLIYAFNATGKTRLCVEYKNITKTPENKHTGVYYNAYSEDLFVWDNDEENQNANINLKVDHSSLSEFHSLLNIDLLEEKLAPYQPKYKFELNQNENPERGIKSITFFASEEDRTPIKISRGEERIFVWCFFLALFEVETWAKDRHAHIFIDDPVSSLDDHNIFVTAQSIFALVEANFGKKRIIISTHHIGLFSILFDWLKRGDRSGPYKALTKPYILSNKGGVLQLKSPSGDVFLYHLHLLQTLQDAKAEQLFKYHIVLLRQVLENIASFLGTARIGFVLSEIKVENTGRTMDMINSLSHKGAYQFQTQEMSDAEEVLFNEVFDKLLVKYQFKLH